MSRDDFLTYLYGVVEQNDLATFWRNLVEAYHQIPKWRVLRRKEAAARIRTVSICMMVQEREARRHG